MNGFMQRVSAKFVEAGKHAVTSSMGVEQFDILFWRKSQYDSYDEAKAQGAVYDGEVCYGYSNYADAMTNVRCALECCDSNWKDEGLMVRLTVDGVFIGDLDLWECY